MVGSRDGFKDSIDVFEVPSRQRTTIQMSLPRCCMGAAVVGDLLIVGGGEVPWFIDPTTNTARVDVFDLRTMTLVRQEALPLPVRGLNAAAVGGKVVFGPGFGAGLEAQVLDTTSWTWTVKALPGTSRALVKVTSEERWACLLGGGGAGVINNVDVYDALHDQWRHFTAPAEITEGAILHGKLYLLGCPAPGQIPEMWILDLEGGVWTTTTRPFDRCITYTAALDPFVIFSSGRAPLTPLFTDETNIFNTLTGEWLSMSGGGEFRFGAIAASKDHDQVYIAGGQRALTVSDGSQRVDILSLASHIGRPYCPATVPNSTGRPARMRAAGMTSLSDNYLTLAAHDAPPGRIGVFAVGTTPVIPPFGSGALCIGGGAGLLSSSVRAVDADGTLAATIDLTQLPLGATRPALPGETLYFQALIRDAIPSPSTHVSDALAVTVTQ